MLFVCLTKNHFGRLSTVEKLRHDFEILNHLRLNLSLLLSTLQLIELCCQLKHQTKTLLFFVFFCCCCHFAFLVCWPRTDHLVVAVVLVHLSDLPQSWGHDTLDFFYLHWSWLTFAVFQMTSLSSHSLVWSLLLIKQLCFQHRHQHWKEWLQCSWSILK